MAVTTPQRPDQNEQNPGDISTRELFNRTLGQRKPTGEESDRAKAAMSSAEQQAATGGGATNQNAPLAEQEKNGFYKPTAQDLYAKSRANRAKGGGRGIFIGVGAGAGIVGVVAGFAFMSLFQLPGIMDTLIGNAEERVEKVFERRIEKAIFKYFFVGDTIATGNPLGDFFANLKTSKFEAKLESKYGLTFERQENGSMRIVKNGTDLGTFSNADELEDFFNRDISSAKEFKKVVKLVVKNDISFFRILKRAKYKKWLMTKYRLTRLGPSTRTEDETDEEYNQRIEEEYTEDVNRQNTQNLTDLLTCDAGDTACEDRNSSGSSDEVESAVEDAVEQATQEVAEGTTDKTLIARATEILTSNAATKSILALTVIDIASVLEDQIDKALNDDSLQKAHAQYVANSSAVLGATMAGYSDATKAGAMDASTVGMFTEKFAGWESSVSYNYIQSGEVKGTDIDDMEKVQATATLPVFLESTKTMFNTVGWAVRLPLKIWFNTAHPIITEVSEYVGGAASWIAETTGVSEIFAQIIPYISQVFTYLLKFIGMYIDPTAAGAQLAMYIHQGFVASYDAFAQESGMRLLTHDEAVAVDNAAEQERLAELADESAFDRLLNLNSSDSLASKIASLVPTNTGTFAMSGLSLITSAPSNLAHITTPSAFAAEDDVIPEDLFGIYPYGATAADLAQPLSATTEIANYQCPENSDDTFNTCSVDKIVLEAANCALVGTSGCPDLESSYTYFAEDDYTAFLEDY